MWRDLKNKVENILEKATVSHVPPPTTTGGSVKAGWTHEVKELWSQDSNGWIKRGGRLAKSPIFLSPTLGTIGAAKDVQSYRLK